MTNLCKKELCTGCTACAQICPKACITMEPDEEGFLRPVIDAGNCVECGRCGQVCPVLNPVRPCHQPTAYAAYAVDTALRLESSSGGVFSELARAILSEGGAIYGAVYDESFRVIHTCAEDEAGLARMRGAKYAQSDLRGIFPEIKGRLEDGQPVLFSGTPCQVGGLKAYLRKEYENLLTVDFVCHSVPSPMAWREYVSFRSRQDNGGELPASVNLRSKESGWSGYSNQFRYKNGHIYSVSGRDSLYMKLFVGGFISRKSCSACSFKGYSRVSDLTIGDFWGIWDIAPEMDDNKGISVVLVQTARGAELLEQIGEKLNRKSVSLEEASRQNPAMLKPSAMNEKRAEAFGWIRCGQIAETAVWFAPQKTPVTKKLYSMAAKVVRKIIR